MIYENGNETEFSLTADGEFTGQRASIGKTRARQKPTHATLPEGIIYISADMKI